MAQAGQQGAHGAAADGGADFAPRGARRTDRPWPKVPADEARPILRAFPGLVPTGVDLMKRSGVLTEGTPDELEGLGLPVFRIDAIT